MSAELLLDTSAALAFVDRNSPWHQAVRERARSMRLGLAGHACFETYSVLTRLPLPARRSPASAARVITTNFPAGHVLDRGESTRAFLQLAEAGIVGGAVYDGMVGLAAASAGVPLVSRDRRAATTYRALGVSFELV